MSITEQRHTSVKKITFDWTCSSGFADETTTYAYDGQVLRINCMSCSTTGYAIYIKDPDGIDLLGGQGATMTSGGYDFGTSTGNTAASLPLSAVSGLITLDVDAGTTDGSDTGQTIVYVR